MLASSNLSKPEKTMEEHIEHRKTFFDTQLSVAVSRSTY